MKAYLANLPPKIWMLPDSVGRGNAYRRRNDCITRDNSGGGSGNCKIYIEPAVISRFSFADVLLCFFSIPPRRCNLLAHWFALANLNR